MLVLTHIPGGKDGCNRGGDGFKIDIIPIVNVIKIVNMIRQCSRESWNQL